MLQPAADALALAVRDGALGKLAVERADGAPIVASPLGDALESAGFRPTPRGLRDPRIVLRDLGRSPLMPISRRAATVAIAAVALALAAALTACSSSSGSGGSSGLQQAMASTSGGSAATAEFQYGNMARLRELGIVDAKRKPVIDTRWQQVVGYGSGQFLSLAIGLKKVIALDLLAADSTVMIGTPPNTAIRISGGVDKAAMTAKLKSLGAEPRTFGSTTGLSLAADNEINRTPALANSGLVNQLDQVVVDDDSMTSSPNGATLQQALGRGTSLLDTGAYHDLADCLGDVIAADIRPAPASDTSTAEFAVGVRDPGSKSGVDHEVLCALPRDGKSTTLRTALSKHLALSAIDPTTRAPISQYATRSQVGSSGAAVQVVLTMKPDGPVGFLLDSVLRGALPAWDGTCQPQAQVTHRC